MSTQLPYTKPEYDAFGWSPLSNSSIPHDEHHGLDFESAREATPRWYGVSSGNGNDGVSHMHPDYYVRTNDPFRLAELAIVSSFKDEWKAKAKKAVDVDGEADYTISATIYEPLDEEPPEETEDEYQMSYSEANGAWLIYEVFPIDDDELNWDEEGFSVGNGEIWLETRCPAGSNPSYDTIEECFDEADLKLVPAD